MLNELSEGLPAHFEPYSGTIRGELLEVGGGKDYATIDLALDYVIGKTWASSTALDGEVTTTQGSATFTGAGLTQIAGDNYILVNSKYLAVKSIESDSSGTLWHGAPDNNSGVAVTIYVLNEFTIKCFEDQTSTAKTLPDGVAVLIVGDLPKYKLNISDSLTIADYCRLEIDYLRVNITTAFAVVGAFGTGRGIVKIGDVYSEAEDVGYAFVVAHMASFTMDNVRGCRRMNVGADYIAVIDADNYTSTTEDHFLIAQVESTDSGHPYTFDNYHQLSSGEVSIGQSSGIEFNAVPVGKVLNIINSEIVALGSIADAEVIYREVNGTINITDSILDNLNSLYEIREGGATVNIIRSTRLDGSAIRFAP